MLNAVWWDVMYMHLCWVHGGDTMVQHFAVWSGPVWHCQWQWDGRMLLADHWGSTRLACRLQGKFHKRWQLMGFPLAPGEVPGTCGPWPKPCYIIICGPVGGIWSLGKPMAHLALGKNSGCIRVYTTRKHQLQDGCSVAICVNALHPFTGRCATITPGLWSPSSVMWPIAIMCIIQVGGGKMDMQLYPCVVIVMHHVSGLDSYQLIHVSAQLNHWTRKKWSP